MSISTLPQSCHPDLTHFCRAAKIPRKYWFLGNPEFIDGRSLASHRFNHLFRYGRPKGEDEHYGYMDDLIDALRNKPSEGMPQLVVINAHGGYEPYGHLFLYQLAMATMFNAANGVGFFELGTEAPLNNWNYDDDWELTLVWGPITHHSRKKEKVNAARFLRGEIDHHRILLMSVQDPVITALELGIDRHEIDFLIDIKTPDLSEGPYQVPLSVEV